MRMLAHPCQTRGSKTHEYAQWAGSSYLTSFVFLGRDRASSRQAGLQMITKDITAYHLESCMEFLLGEALSEGIESKPDTSASLPEHFTIGSFGSKLGVSPFRLCVIQ